MVKSKVTFTIDLRKFCSRPITIFPTNFVPKAKNGNMACIGVYGKLRIEVKPMLIDRPMPTAPIPAAVR